MRWISADDIRSILKFSTCTALMREAMILVSSGQADLPLRQGFPILESGNMQGTMSGALGGKEAAFGTKLVSLYPNNSVKGYPSHMGLYALFEAEHGSPLAILDANALTAIRTAAATAAATDELARQNARTLLIVGTGEQAENHIRALLDIRPFQEIRVWGRSPEKADTFVKKMLQNNKINVSSFYDLSAALDGADIVTTVTASSEPLIYAKDLNPGVHVNAVGASQRSAMELAPDCVIHGRFFVDYRVSALNQAGELLAAMEDGGLSEKDAIEAEIGDVYAGAAQGRVDDLDITIYKSLGNAAQDIAAARYVFNEAEKRNMGVKLSL